MKRQLTLIIFLLASGLFSAQVPAPAKVPIIPDDEMISGAEDIAVVNITKVEQSDCRGYSQKATALVEKTLKGSLQPQVCFYGEKFSKGGSVPTLEPGRSLVFLLKDGSQLCCLESLHASRPIRDGKLLWSASDMSEKAALNDIARRLAVRSRPRISK